MKRLPVDAILWLTLWGTGLHAQPAAAVSFARDVQPIFREHCYGCHGPTLQMRGLRLDRRRSAMPNRVGANRASIVSGNSAASPVYLKLIGKQPGLPMPPDGGLSAQQIATIKTWIDEGAAWPDEVAGEAPVSPVDSKAQEMMDALRKGAQGEFATLVRNNPANANGRGRGGSTPLMYAALYGGTESVRLLLERGADPNARNDGGATALMYAVDVAGKTELLLERGADPNARSDEGQTPLLIATMRPGSSAVVRLLLGHGASRSTESAGGRTPLISAAYAGDAETIQLLIDGLARNTRVPLAQAVHANCAACVAALLPLAGEKDLSDALPSAAQVSDIQTMKMLREHGGRAGANLLPAIAMSPGSFPEDLITSLIGDGADVNAETRMGGTLLDLARLQGDTPLVHVLRNAGAKGGSPAEPEPPKPSPAASARAAVERSLPVLQRADASFLAKAGCVSCHNNSLTEMALAAARESGIAVNEPAAQQQLQSVAAFLEANRERALQGLGLPGGWDTVGYILLGMAAAKYPAGEITEPWARYLKNTQYTDGAWRVQAQRPPVESSDFQVTATALRAMQAYAPRPQRAEYEKAVRRAARWLETAQPTTTEDRAFQLLGLHWARGNREVIGRAGKALLAEQRSDGGWAQLSTLASDAYATGQALVALRQSGILPPASPAYQRGARFLVNSQLADGSWFVRSRTLPAQPYFDSGFPHGRDQFISAAATNWAVMALAP